MQTILVTGGSGFIGSNFLLNVVNKYPQITFVNLDKLTYSANSSYLESIEVQENYQFIQGDICDSTLLNALFKQYLFDGVIHFAAESHVDNSIAAPDQFIETNIKGTFNLLEAARKVPNIRFHHISTDEIFGSIIEGSFTENSPYAPNNPYSASKASSNFLVRSYTNTYGLDAVITNCSNNFGPRQHAEKLIPTIIRKARRSEPIPIYGDGKHVRDWLYVKDHCEAIDKVFHRGKTGESYNIGGGYTCTNLELAHQICSLLNCDPKLITFVQDRAGHDRRYHIDSTKIEKELGWEPTTPFNEALKQTVEWYSSEALCV